ncbi:disease resistance protein RPV1-like [Malus sylvestris]|uniref:disease resistance protein RPV1-like n=1 Tax=Malus sylvestris TaxID=3752 RepID=UPI0021AD44F0|nr:disease resistance protein RPV1-like [Malus sylvestris]
MNTADGKYDVFLSFRGETRKGITDHLYHTLNDYKFNVFRDNDRLICGDVIKENLKQAIKESRLAVIMFSKGYAGSSWCLDELVEIMECSRTQGQHVFPIFFDVDTSDVRHQTGDFETAFKNHEQKFEKEMVRKWGNDFRAAAEFQRDEQEFKEKVRTWRDTLSAAAGLSGKDFQVTDGHEGSFIREVVGQIATILKKPCLNVATNPVGIDSRVQEISNYLDVEGSNDVRIIGIWGMGGLGKSTIAKAIFNEYQHRFSGASFLPNVREDKKLVDSQNKLLFDILRLGHRKVGMPDEGTKEINTRLRQIKVLVIIDDIDSVAQIDTLAIKRDSFGPGSRIVITTRDKSLLKTPEVVDKACSLPAMNDDEALELLSWRAFQKSSPNEGFHKVSREAVRYCGGLPHALKAVGSYLHKKTPKEWTSALKKWNESQPYPEIHEKLKISYDGLKVAQVEDIFLDVSCFFTGMDKDRVMAILDGCYCEPTTDIEVLKERCLVTDDPKGSLMMMHRLIRDMGREIVRARSPKKLQSRCRLWHHEDVINVLRKKSGTEEIEGIALDSPEADKLSFSTETFRNMRNLRLLKIKGVKFTGDCEHLPDELRWLSMSDFPQQAIPEDFNQPNVVDIDLSCSNIQVWNDNVSLEKLKFLNLGSCDNLKQSPDFSRIPNIERLILEACKSLSKIHHSIIQLRNLKYLSVANCQNLQKIPDLPTKLEILKADECIALEVMPNFSKMSSMLELHLNHSPKLTEILGLDKSLNNMIRIHMEGCTNLTAAFKKAILQEWSASGNGDLFLPGNDLPSGFTCVDLKDEIFMPQCFGYDAKALTLCVVYSSDSKSKHTEFSTPLYATVINRHESYIWLGHLSNNKLNVNGGAKINVGAHLSRHRSTDDIHLRVQKIGVYQEQENLVNKFSNLMARSSEYDNGNSQSYDMFK